MIALILAIVAALMLFSVLRFFAAHLAYPFGPTVGGCVFSSRKCVAILRIQAIEWAPAIGRAARDEFVAAQQVDNPSFAIRQADRTGGTREADNRTEFYPVTYVEPLQGNEAAVGFDLASDPERRVTILHTIATGTVAATAPIRLIQTPADLNGILLTLSVPRGPNGPGVLLVVLRMDEFIAAALGPASQLLGAEFVDQAANQPFLFDAPISLYDHSITFGGRNYAIRTAPTPFYFTRHQGWQSWAVLSPAY